MSTELKQIFPSSFLPSDLEGFRAGVSSAKSPPGSPSRDPVAAAAARAALAAKKQITPNRGYSMALGDMHESPSNVPYARPDWCEKTHRLLRQIAEVNRAGPVDLEAVREVQEISQRLMQEGNPNEILHFMKMVTQFYFVGAKQIFFTMLSVLRKLSPEIEPYIKDVDTDEADEGPVLSNAGIDRIFQMFETEFRYPKGLLKAANVSELPGLIAEMIHSSSLDMVCGWTVQNDLMFEDPHVVPVFGLKIEGKTHIFIFDSLGHTIDGHDNKISASLEELLKHFSGIENIDRDLALYSYGRKRQNGWTLDCVTFSMIDLKCLLERHSDGKSLVNFYAAQKDSPFRLVTPLLDSTTRLPIYEIDLLPAEMMKPTQSLRAIQEYERSAPLLPLDHVPSFRRCSPSGGVEEELQTVSHMRQKIARVERFGDRGPANLYVEQKRLEHMVYLLGLHLKEMKESGAEVQGDSSFAPLARLPHSMQLTRGSLPSLFSNRGAEYLDGLPDLVRDAAIFAPFLTEAGERDYSVLDREEAR